jgi:K+-transporting ATPase ATPase B chain
MNHIASKQFLNKALLAGALKQSFLKLNPATMILNPVMFTVWVGTVIMGGVCIWIAGGANGQGSLTYNLVITLLLFVTLLFANFAEAIAEARGKAHANSLRKTREDTLAKLILPVGEMYVNEIIVVPASKKRRYFYM